jgi:hypothetical protein
VIGEISHTFIMLKHKGLQTIAAVITDDKITELSCIANDFCKFFGAMMSKSTLGGLESAIITVPQR